MKKSLAHAVSKGVMLLLLAQAGDALAGVEYKVEWDSTAERYRVYMRPNATPVPDLTLSAQVTLRLPYSSASRFVIDDLTSVHSPGASWTASSKVAGPPEDTSVEYISFTPTISSAGVFSLQAGVEQEIFSFRNVDYSCQGPVAIMDNKTDPFNQPDGASNNSAGTNPGIEFSSIAWPGANDFIGIYGGVADCSVSTNNPPVAVNDSVTGEQGNAITVNVLNNDTDSDGDTLSITAVTQGANGSVSISGGQIVYKPTGAFSGTDSFTYTISDGNNGTSTATVNVTVNAAPSNNVPVATDDAVGVEQDSSVRINVVSNDTDADGDLLTVSTITQGTDGSVAIVGGDVVYTPNAGFSGSDSFTYVVSDGKGGLSKAIVNVTVNAVVASDSDGDGLTDQEEVALGTNPNSADSDNDGISDNDEIGGDKGNPIDTDNDGIIDALDSDDDGDSIPTVDENYNGGTSANDDTDGDGIPDYLDNDDDNDGILSIFENYNNDATPLNDDTDKDGIPDYRDMDDDNDGVLTSNELPDLNKDGNPEDALDSDQDGVPDYLQNSKGGAAEKVAIPTMTEWAQILLSMLLGLVALRSFVNGKRNS